MFSPQWREDDAFIVDEDVADLARTLTRIYDKEQWYSDEVPDAVWDQLAGDRALSPPQGGAAPTSPGALDG